MKKDPKEHVILIVEDEDAIRLTLRDYLKKKGWNVLVASDGVGAIKLLLDNEIDFIITDYRMNVLGGDYWIKFLHTFLKEKRIIITSGFLNPEFEIPFKIMYKPFDYSELESLILKELGA